jgi:hypothetical protein
MLPGEVRQIRPLPLNTGSLHLDLLAACAAFDHLFVLPDDLERGGVFMVWEVDCRIA